MSVGPSRERLLTCLVSRFEVRSSPHIWFGNQLLHQQRCSTTQGGHSAPLRYWSMGGMGCHPYASHGQSPALVPLAGDDHDFLEAVESCDQIVRQADG